MQIDISDLGQIESFYNNFDEPEGFGAFDEDQLNERNEDIFEEEIETDANGSCFSDADPGL
jgi:hypothetical protein